LFTVIFTALLPSAENPSAELRELGLDDSFLRYRGVGAYSPGSPILDWNWGYRFAATTSYRKLGLFYLRHPGRAAHVLGIGLIAATYQRPLYIGNFDKAAGYPPGAKSFRFSAWSVIKQRIFAGYGWAYCLYSLALLAILIRRYPFSGLCFAWMVSIALAVGALADAAETTRHLLIFNFLVDLSLICSAATLFHAGSYAVLRDAKQTK
jgi:hypothetical protein